VGACKRRIMPTHAPLPTSPLKGGGVDPAHPMTTFHPHAIALKLLGFILAVWLVALIALLAHAQMDEGDSGTAIILYPPGWSAEESLAASHQADARLLTTTAFDNVLVVAGDEPGLVGRLKQAGGIIAFRNLTLGEISFAGCLGAEF
jgi:hypothetical protein